jgi:hypothetical protein
MVVHQFEFGGFQPFIYAHIHEMNKGIPLLQHTEKKVNYKIKLLKKGFAYKQFIVYKNHIYSSSLN